MHIILILAIIGFFIWIASAAVGALIACVGLPVAIVILVVLFAN